MKYNSSAERVLQNHLVQPSSYFRDINVISNLHAEQIFPVVRKLPYYGFENYLRQNHSLNAGYKQFYQMYLARF